MNSWLFPPRTRQAPFAEKWSFVGKKEKHCDPAAPADAQQGDSWDHVAFDPEHRLVVSGVPGKRTEEKVRKTCCFSKDWQVHEAMTCFTRYSYNFCWPVRTLRVKVGRKRYRQRTPARAAGLTVNVWTIREWATYPAVRRIRDEQCGQKGRQTS